MTVTVRFAPSPTGFLHIGGARTALFNWLFARHHGGSFRLRIEDTDRVRSTEEAVAAIVDGLSWLGLDWDGEIVFQFARAERHAEIARQLLAAGRAYYCFCTPAELEAMRERARAEKRSVRYDGTWRNRDPSEAPPGVAPAIRLKAPQEGITTIHDRVQGEVTVANAELDDLIILRADGTPTYNLSVVADDHDMGITHVIRGDDHLNNAFRQTQIYRALDWPVPEFAHIPLIHDASGAKMSKRRGTVAVGAYRERGYLPEAMRNYLLRLGWSHGDDEIVSTEEAIRWFDLDAVGRAPARFDLAKLDNVNGHYIRAADDRRLVVLVIPRFEALLGRTLSAPERGRLLRAMPALKLRAKTLVQLVEKGWFVVERTPIKPDEHVEALLIRDKGGTFPVTGLPGSQMQQSPGSVTRLLPAISEVLEKTAWTTADLTAAFHSFEKERHLRRGELFQLLRAALTRSKESPGIYVVMDILGREETLGRIADAAGDPGA